MPGGLKYPVTLGRLIRKGILEGPRGAAPTGVPERPEETALTRDRATGRDVVLAIGENMRQSLEPLVTKTIAPSLYQVYLHADDYDRLRALFGELDKEAKELLDAELKRMNRGSVPALARILPKKKDDAVPAGP